MSWDKLTTPRVLERHHDHQNTHFPVGYKFRCQSCRTVFAIDRESDYATGRLTGAHFANCPNCNYYTELGWWGSRRLKPEERAR